MPVRFLQNVNVTDAFARDSATKNVQIYIYIDPAYVLHPAE